VFVTAGQRDQRGERDRQHPGPPAHRTGARPQQLTERDGLRPRYVVPPAGYGAVLGGELVCRRQHGISHVGHVHRLVQAAAVPGDGQHRRAGQHAQQPGQVAVARVAVDHRRAQDRPVQGGPPDLLLRRQPDLLGRRAQGRRHRGGGDEHGPLEPGLLGRGDDARSVPAAERGQAGQDVATLRGGLGERPVKPGGVGQVPGGRPRAAVRHRLRRGRAAGQRQHLVAVAGRRAQHVPAEEAAAAEDEELHPRSPSSL
jgi:hypothetical protein